MLPSIEKIREDLEYSCWDSELSTQYPPRQYRVAEYYVEATARAKRAFKKEMKSYGLEAWFDGEYDLYVFEYRVVNN